MVKLTKIKFPKKQLAFALSAALLISFMPISPSAAEKKQYGSYFYKIGRAHV